MSFLKNGTKLKIKFIWTSDAWVLLIPHRSGVEDEKDQWDPLQDKASSIYLSRPTEDVPGPDILE